MIDGSHLSFEDNIALTQEAVRVAHSVGVSVEAELGTIGENEGSSEGGADEILYTDPEQAKEFVNRTGCDTLAVAIGTAHGLYPEHLPPKIQIDRLEKINNLVDIPLGLHGGSSNADEDIRRSVQAGEYKIKWSRDRKDALYR